MIYDGFVRNIEIQSVKSVCLCCCATCGERTFSFKLSEFVKRCLDSKVIGSFYNKKRALYAQYMLCRYASGVEMHSVNSV